MKNPKSQEKNSQSSGGMIEFQKENEIELQKDTESIG